MESLESSRISLYLATADNHAQSQTFLAQLKLTLISSCSWNLLQLTGFIDAVSAGRHFLIPPRKSFLEFVNLLMKARTILTKTGFL